MRSSRFIFYLLWLWLVVQAQQRPAGFCAVVVVFQHDLEAARLDPALEIVHVVSEHIAKISKQRRVQKLQFAAHCEPISARAPVQMAVDFTAAAHAPLPPVDAAHSIAT